MAPNDVQQVASAEHSVEPVAEIEVRIFDSDTCDTVISELDIILGFSFAQTLFLFLTLDYIETIPLYANKTVKIGRDLDNK